MAASSTSNRTLTRSRCALPVIASGVSNAAGTHQTMSKYNDISQQLRSRQQHWLITGVAGFIGSNLLEALLKLGQKVRGLDNFSTGHQANLDEVRGAVGEETWRNFSFVRGDICNL